VISKGVSAAIDFQCGFWDKTDWVIVGGESGPKARKMDEGWVYEIRENCDRNNVPFFFKQWGGRNKKKAGRSLNGRV